MEWRKNERVINAYKVRVEAGQELSRDFIFWPEIVVDVVMSLAENHVFVIWEGTGKNVIAYSQSQRCKKMVFEYAKANGINWKQKQSRLF